MPARHHRWNHADPCVPRRAGVVVAEDTAEPQYDPEAFETNVPNLFIAAGQLAGSRRQRCSSRTAPATVSASPE
jgi:hypothetical protein